MKRCDEHQPGRRLTATRFQEQRTLQLRAGLRAKEAANLGGLRSGLDLE